MIARLPFPATCDVVAQFDGVGYDAAQDAVRLRGQLARVYGVMRDGQWRTLREIEEATGAPSASASAQLRNLRKARFGGHQVDRRPRGDRSQGLYEYRVTL